MLIDRIIACQSGIGFSLHLLIAVSCSLLCLSDVKASPNPCEIPFSEMVDPRTGTLFQTADALNTTADLDPGYNYESRYLVADLDTKNHAGQCKGYQEKYQFINAENPDLNVYPELRDRATLDHFIRSVQGAKGGQGHYSAPGSKAPVQTVGGRKFCIGQTVSLCEIRNNRPFEIARFATSGMRGNSAPTLYAKLNIIELRSWAEKRPYTAADAERDVSLGGVAASQASGVRLSHYVSGGGWTMPNFMQWQPVQGFRNNGAVMGLHQLAQGETNVYVPGAPVSHGCLRLSRYGAILNRWWTPRGAKMFIHFTAHGYREFP